MGVNWDRPAAPLPPDLGPEEEGPRILNQVNEGRLNRETSEDGNIDFIILRRVESSGRRVFSIRLLQEHLDTTNPYTNALYRINRVFGQIVGLFDSNVQVVQNVPAQRWQEHLIDRLESAYPASLSFFEGHHAVEGFRRELSGQTPAWVRFRRMPAGSSDPVILELPIEKPKTQPDDVLEEMTTALEEKPQEKEFLIKFTGKWERGADAGGLRRQFMSDLFEGAVTQSKNLKFKTNDWGEFHPVAKAKESETLGVDEKRGYERLGQTMVLCHRSGDPIGQLFDEQTFRGLFAFTVAELQTPFEEIPAERRLEIYREMTGDPEKGWIEADPSKLSDLELRRALLGAMDYDASIGDEWYAKTPDEIRGNYETFRKAISKGREEFASSKLKIAERVSPLHAMAVGMEKPKFDTEPGDILSGIKLKYENDPTRFSKALQGEISNQVILACVDLDDGVPEKAREWFQSWLESADTAKKKDLIKAVTGSPTIPPAAGKKILFTNLGEDAIVLHTCGWQIDLPSALFSNEERFHLALDASLGGKGFSTL